MPYLAANGNPYGQQQISAEYVLNLLRQTLSNLILSGKLQQYVGQQVSQIIESNPQHAISTLINASGGNAGYFAQVAERMIMSKAQTVINTCQQTVPTYGGLNAAVISGQNLAGLTNGLNQPPPSALPPVGQMTGMLLPVQNSQSIAFPPASNPPNSTIPPAAVKPAVKEQEMILSAEPKYISSGASAIVSELEPGTKLEKTLISYTDTQGGMNVYACQNSIGAFANPVEAAQYIEQCIPFDVRSAGIFTYDEIRVIDTPTGVMTSYLKQFIEAVKKRNLVTPEDYYNCLSVFDELSDNPNLTNKFKSGMTAFLLNVFNQVGLTGGFGNMSERISWMITRKALSELNAFLPDNSAVATLSNDRNKVASIVDITRSAWFKVRFMEVMNMMLTSVPESINIINYSNDADKLAMFAKVIANASIKVTSRSFMKNIYTVFATTVQSTRDKARAAVNNVLTEFTNRHTLVTIPRQVIVTNVPIITTGYKAKANESIIDYLISRVMYDNSYKQITGAVVQIDSASLYRVFDCGISSDSCAVIV